MPLIMPPKTTGCIWTRTDARGRLIALKATYLLVFRMRTDVFGRDVGGARRDRTADLLHAMQALSQLSYGPNARPAMLGIAPGTVNQVPVLLLQHL